MRIGAIEISPPVILAPMAGITNHAFRLICKEFGAGLVCTDMISSCGIYYGNQKTLGMFDWTAEERPVAVQIFGAEPSVMADAAALVQDSGADIVDINVGCPVRKIRKTGAGAGLIEDLDTARRIMESVVKAVNIPVTVKTRKGLDAGHISAVEVAKIAEDAGISAISIHGRTAAQGYSGSADWSIIGRVKRSVGIPVVGNGDVKSPQDAKRMLDETGCDAVMIGRGALGNPWIFRRTARFLETGDLLPEPTYIERVEMARKHLRMMVALYGEDRGVREMRSQIAWYIKGMPGAGRLRRLSTQATSLQKMEDVLTEICM